MDKWTERQIAYVLQKGNEGIPWAEVTSEYNLKFKQERTTDGIRKCYSRYKEIFNASSSEYEVKLLKDTYRAKKSTSLKTKENKTILERWNERDDLVIQFKDLLRDLEIHKYKTPKSLVFEAPKGKKAKQESMTLELLFSDVHFGKYIKDEEGNVKIDHLEIRKRVRKLSDQVIKEVKRNAAFWKIERFVIGMLGDLIESSTMHGEESLKGCEFGTSRQINEAITSIYQDLLIPLSQTGLPIIDIFCITGNHDRSERDQTYVRPGENNLTYIIYKQLELLCEVSNLTNIKFHIASKAYISTSIYGKVVVYEHGNLIGNLNRDTLTRMMNCRQNQIGHIVDFYRLGHWHERVEYGQGKIQVNASVVGQDDYSEGKGFDSEALQVLNYYVETSKRRTSFFRSFPIYLEERK